MHIFLDESGQFKIPQSAMSTINYEAIVAIVLDELTLAKLEEIYGDKEKEYLRHSAKEVIEFVSQNNCKIFGIIFDANLSTALTIGEHQKDWIQSIYEGVKAHPESATF